MITSATVILLTAVTMRSPGRTNGQVERECCLLSEGDNPGDTAQQCCDGLVLYGSREDLSDDDCSFQSCQFPPTDPEPPPPPPSDLPTTSAPSAAPTKTPTSPTSLPPSTAPTDTNPTAPRWGTLCDYVFQGSIWGASLIDGPDIEAICDEFSGPRRCTACGNFDIILDHL